MPDAVRPRFQDVPVEEIDEWVEDVARAEVAAVLDALRHRLARLAQDAPLMIGTLFSLVEQAREDARG